MIESRIRNLIGDALFEAPGDGSVVSLNCSGFFVAIECDLCATTIDFIVWFIVDGDARPDLVKLAAQGRLHDPVCSHCGHVGHLESHLLLLRRDQEPALLFSPARASREKSHSSEIAQFVARLQRRMGNEWDERWVTHRGTTAVAEVDRSMLPVVLDAGSSPAR